tara:strand:+ start:534 stop:746 length:213 start_codon:yes stop_codon:yes gene_type:complete
MVSSGNASSKFSVNSGDMKKLGTGMLIAIAGAILTYGSEWISGADFGIWTATISAGWAVVTNFVRKFTTN